MKIRTNFAILAATIVAIPMILLTMGMALYTLARGPDTTPNYDQLAPGAEVLTDKVAWEKVRTIVANRPLHSHVLVFNESLHLIYSSVPLGTLAKPGGSLNMEESIKSLQASTAPRNILVTRMKGSNLWVAVVQGEVPGAFMDRQADAIHFGTGLLFILVLSVALAVFMGRTLANSVVKLEEAARKIAKGDLKSPVPAQKGNNEVQALGDALETMRRALVEEEARQSRFVMGVSHDLKTPLALIKGYVELIKDGPTGSAESRDAHFEVIQEKVDQLDVMIDHLIDYGRVNTGEWQETWKPVALGPFLEEFWNSLEPDARLLSRNLVHSITLPEGWTVTCDIRSVRRSLENLVHNALRYTAEGGTVGLVAHLTPAGGAEVVVWDDGPGLDPLDLPHLFDAFYRGSHSRTEPGMGLGLSIVKTILDSHGWEVRAESNRGARFVVTIPPPPQGPTEVSAKSAGTEGRGRRDRR